MEPESFRFIGWGYSSDPGEIIAAFSSIPPKDIEIVFYHFPSILNLYKKVQLTSVIAKILLTVFSSSTIIFLVIYANSPLS